MFSLSNMRQYLPFCVSMIPSISIPSVLLTTAAMLVGTLFHELLAVSKKLIPRRLFEKIFSKLKSLIQNYHSEMTLIIDEYVNGLSVNEMFEASEIYLRPKISPSVERLKISKAPGDKEICVSINQGEKIMDTFGGVQLTWQMISTKSQETKIDNRGHPFQETVERRSTELKFHKKYREKVLSSYLPYVLNKSKDMKKGKRVVKLYSCGGKLSSPIHFRHPSTFDTLAMDPTKKKELIDDLDRFVMRRDFYKRVGKSWKRGYLLYGPPGTGKSSLIAAMANYLKFHVYDLELTSIRSNSDFKQLLVSTANQSILVIEDIDCSRKFQNRQDGVNKNDDKRLPLSALLNFIDGLWSSCGDKKIIIFTTNHKDRLDPALLRPGRMDMHIHMSYCTPCGFKILASNYLGIKDHSMFPEIEKLVTEVEVTAAEIAEELIKSDEADIALGGLSKFIRTKKTEHDKANAEGEKVVNEQAEESPGNKEGAEKESKEN
ncbi:hypothetical protein ACSBR2_006782 [Camellia fascicularis]